VKVYRIERDDGTGPYVNGILAEIAEVYGPEEAGYHPDLNPHPEDDGINPYHPGCYVYGFDSIEQLQSWFYCHAVREQLGQAGYKISVYESESVVKGKRQLVFQRTRKIDSEPLA
jgi:hypothetical protein